MPNDDASTDQLLLIEVSNSCNPLHGVDHTVLVDEQSSQAQAEGNEVTHKDVDPAQNVPTPTKEDVATDKNVQQTHNVQCPEASTMAPSNEQEGVESSSSCLVSLPPPLFYELCGQNGTEQSNDQIALHKKYLELLVAFNGQFRVTITDAERAWFRHINDSLMLVPFIDKQRSEAGGMLRVLDIGSGPGLPGIPIAIGMPHAHMHLNERRGKTAEWLDGACRSLGLPNTVVVVGRVQEMDTAKYRDYFDAAVCRRLSGRGTGGALTDLMEYAFPLLKKGGRLVAMKGKKADTEVLDAQPLIHEQGWTGVQVHHTFPGTENAAAIVECVKVGHPQPSNLKAEEA